MVADQELMYKAEKRAKEKVGFYIHFACYLAVNASLFVFFWSTVQDKVSLIPILFGPLLGWGVGIVAHFVSVFFGSGKHFDTMVKKEYESLKNREKE